MSDKKDQNTVNLNRRSKMIPFYSTEVGSWILARFDGEHSLMVHNRSTDALVFTIFSTGATKDGLPNVERCLDFLTGTGSPILLGRNDSLVKDIPLEADSLDSAVGEYFILALHEKRELTGGRQFNQWEIFHLAGAKQLIEKGK